MARSFVDRFQRLLWIPTAAFIAFLSFTSNAKVPTLAAPTFPALTAFASAQANPVAVESLSLGPSVTYTVTVYLPAVMRSPSTSRQSPIYWGALVAGQAPSTDNMQAGGVFDSFEATAQKKMAIIHWGQSWQMSGSYQGFYAPWFDKVRAHGSIPLIDWASRRLEGGVSQPDLQLSTIYNGVHDDYIRQWALDAKAWGHPFFLRFDWEMNGDWQFPWSEQLNGNQPGDYIKAWRHVHDIFSQVGATNATWVWCPNISSGTTRPMSSLYPGDDYVDWTCLDGYNKESQWLDPYSVFTGSETDWLYDSYTEILKVAPTKPIMVGETASIEARDGGAKKAAWIADFLTSHLPKDFPKIKAIVWFNWDDDNPAYTFPIESSRPSQSAFAAAIGSSYYAANDFANFDISPIPPLP